MIRRSGSGCCGEPYAVLISIFNVTLMAVKRPFCQRHSTDVALSLFDRTEATSNDPCVACEAAEPAGRIAAANAIAASAPAARRKHA